MTHIYQCTLTLLEPTFFSSREVSNTYFTEPFIGNYALAYALNLVQAPYHNRGAIHYVEHLNQLNQRGIYITPATIQNAPRFVFRQFNAQPDAYWFAFANNAIVTRPDGAWLEKSGPVWYVHRPGQKRKKIGLENRPQFGRIRALAIGNVAVFYVLSREPLQLPRYIRLGKFMSKARVEHRAVRGEIVEREQTNVPFLLNPADLAPSHQLIMFDLLNVPPMPLVHHATLAGRFYALPGGVYLPANMRFGVEEKGI